MFLGEGELIQAPRFMQRPKFNINLEHNGDGKVDCDLIRSKCECCTPVPCLCEHLIVEFDFHTNPVVKKYISVQQPLQAVRGHVDEMAAVFLLFEAFY